MDDKPDGKRWAWGWTAWIVVVVPVLYIASYGPAVWPCARVDPTGKRFTPVAWYVYRPLASLSIRTRTSGLQIKYRCLFVDED